MKKEKEVQEEEEEGVTFATEREISKQLNFYSIAFLLLRRPFGASFFPGECGGQGRGFLSPGLLCRLCHFMGVGWLGRGPGLDQPAPMPFQLALKPFLSLL